MERSQRHTTSKEFYQPNNYYNVFGSIQENTSDHFEEPRSKRRISEEKETKQYGSYDPAEFLSKYLQTHQNLSSDSRFTLLDNTPRPLIEGKALSKESIYAPPSISDRLKQDHNKSKPMDTIYSTKRKFYEDEDKGYIFHSGPLLDDKGEGSDYEDYFGDVNNMDLSIQDEEIKANHFNQNISNYNISKESLFLSKLLSPKNDSVVSNSILDRSGK